MEYFAVKRDERSCGRVLRQQRYRSGEGWELESLTFPTLEETGLVKHLFTTRLGGVSDGMYATLNLSFARGDDEERVLANYRRVAEVLGCGIDDIVASHQTHTTNIRLVTKADGGKGVTRQRDYADIDGLITDETGVALACFYADCVPLYFVDTKNRAIGLAHSGWRGTVQGMGARMTAAMGEAFGTRPEDLLTAIGPSICRACYEVGEDVAEAFRGQFLEREVLRAAQSLRAAGTYDREQLLAPLAAPGKYRLDLWLANAVVLSRAGLAPTQIAITDICTCDNPRYLFSHRASQGKRGNLGAFLMLKEN